MKKIIPVLISLAILIVVPLSIFWIINREGDEKMINDKNLSEKGVEYILNYPQIGESVQCPFEITGEIPGFWYFEAMFSVKVVDKTGNLVYLTNAQAEGDWMTTNMVPFRANIECEAERSIDAIMILEKANMSDLPENNDEIEIPITLMPTEKMKVEVFFGKTQTDGMDCAEVYGVEREIPKTLGVAKASIQELLKGVLVEEEQEGYFTQIPEGVDVNYINIIDGTAYIDFSSKLNENVAGSCRVLSIRSQIENTLKQFESINNVVISVEGESEEILQP